jgi:phosphohistidine phosphatase
MKRLLLLRHAETNMASATESDEDRELTAKGEADALALGVLMRQKDIVPDLILCSTATRAQQTCNLVMESGQFDAPRMNRKDLYNPISDQALLEAIKKTPDSYDTILVISHNFAVFDLVGHFVRKGASETSDVLNRFWGILDDTNDPYSPGTLAAFACSINAWHKLDPEKTLATLTHLLLPREYNPRNLRPSGTDRPEGKKSEPKPPAC